MSSARILENSIYHYKKSNDGKNTNPVSIALQCSTNRTIGTSFFEIEESQPRHSSSLSRVAFRRVTWSKRQLMVDTYPTYFSIVDSSGVVAPWCGSRPRIDVLTCFAAKPIKFDRVLNSDRGGVANINRDDTFPPHSNFIKGIDNHDSFIKNNYSWSNKYQPRSESNQSCPERGGHAALKRKVKKALCSVDSNKNQDDPGKDEAASRTETLGIFHKSIISRKEQR